MRIERNTVDYFPHDARASEGDTLTILESHFGNDGYAFWFKLLERLAHTENHYIDCNDLTKWNLMCAKANTTPEKAIIMVDMLAELGAIDPELWGKRIIWCQKFVENITVVYKNRRRDAPPKPTCSLQVTTPDNPITTGDNAITMVNQSRKAITTGKSTQSRVEESRVEESRIPSSPVGSQGAKTIPPKDGKPKKPSKGQPPDPRVSEIFAWLEKERGFTSPSYGGEGQAIKAMLKSYSPEDIKGCYFSLKQQNFWRDKTVTMMKLRVDIGTILSRLRPAQDFSEAKAILAKQRQAELGGEKDGVRTP